MYINYSGDYSSNKCIYNKFKVRYKNIIVSINKYCSLREKLRQKYS